MNSVEVHIPSATQKKMGTDEAFNKAVKVIKRRYDYLLKINKNIKINLVLKLHSIDED